VSRRKSQLFSHYRLNGRITWLENGDFIDGRADLCINIKFLQEEGMSRVIRGKSDVKPVATIAPDYGRIFAIPEVPDMNISVRRFRDEKLANQGRQQPKAEYDCQINDLSLECPHNQRDTSLNPC
jgi:hypothetical protein